MSDSSNNEKHSDDTDGRAKYEWQSKYPEYAQKEILHEARFLFVMLSVALVILSSNWLFFSVLIYQYDEIIFKEINNNTVKVVVYYMGAGLLGGVVFSMKYFYRVVARGFWHQDRKYWRFMSPFISMVVSIIVGVLIQSGMFGGDLNNNLSGVIAVGFLAGYFADEAVGKMYEIANVIFGKSTDPK